MKHLIALFVSVALFAAQAPLHAQASKIEQEVDKLLAAVGGRDIWADAHGFTMSEILHSDQFELPVIRHYWVDFRSPRIMESTEGNGLRQTRALNVDRGWTVRDEEYSDWPDAQVAGWRSFWPGIPTRVFHLLATNDPGIHAEWRDGVIDIFVDDTRVVWIATDPEGTPVAYGREDRHTDTHLLGRPLQYGDVTLWSEAIEPGGDWRVVMVDYRLLNKPHTQSFEYQQ
ncbi:MAG: hypothetical protein AAFX56_06405 [Pseudomonadota bacterium]